MREQILILFAELDAVALTSSMTQNFPDRLRPQTVPVKSQSQKQMRLHNHDSFKSSLAGGGEKLSCLQSTEGLKPECLKCPFVSNKFGPRRSRCYSSIRWTAVYWSMTSAHPTTMSIKPKQLQTFLGRLFVGEKYTTR